MERKIINRDMTGTNSDSIIFCRTSGPYGEFSNFYRSPIIIDGVYWPTTEHLYQASKFIADETREKIRQCSSPASAAKMGRSLDGVRADWECIKYSIMKDIIRQKVSQHKRIKDLLLDTGDMNIIEYSKKDKIWGSGADFTGNNWLGKIWMEIRSEIRHAGQD